MGVAFLIGGWGIFNWGGGGGGGGGVACPGFLFPGDEAIVFIGSNTGQAGRLEPGYELYIEVYLLHLSAANNTIM